MARKILIGVAAVIAVLLIVIATRPAILHIERSLVIVAPPEAVFTQVNDLRAFSAWSPYTKIDPQMKRTFEGPTSGVGAICAWTGNYPIGEGRMTIEKSEKPTFVEIKIEFVKPWAMTRVTTFTFAPAPEGTKVTWALDGQNNFMSKAISLFVDVDAVMGGDFERGLAAMKVAAERAKADFEDKKPAEQK